MDLPALGPGDAVILEDVQVDFCPGGALPVAGGDEIIPVLNQWIHAAEAGGALVVAPRDWHPPGHISFFERGGPWPTHCVRDTAGAKLHPDLIIPPNTLIVNKATARELEAYSSFDGTKLAHKLSRLGIRRVWIGGLALDVCVRATVLDAVKAGFETHLIKDATRALDHARGEAALQEMRNAGVSIEERGKP